jgi:chorismate mutase/prephenate dehydratase
MTNTTLQQARETIDRIDQQMLALLNQRAAAAQHIGQIKKKADPDAPLYRPEREAQVLRKMQTNNPGPLNDTAVTTVFREIMSVCLALEQPQTVAFLGPTGTYTEAAVQKHFGQAIHRQPKLEIADIFHAVETGEAKYGVVPIENSAEGMVDHTLDSLMQTKLYICGEQTLPIQHQLLSQAQTLDQIQTVYAHPQALAQCRSWLNRQLPQAICNPVSSNGEAARLVTEQTHTAAIASCQAAEHYKLAILARNIEDTTDNSTRFIIISKHYPEPSGQDKTSLLLSTKNQPGSLYQLLAPFAKHNISMTRIESRPSRRGTWDYVFFIDIIGHQADPTITAALTTLQRQACTYQLLGSYPQGF